MPACLSVLRRLTQRHTLRLVSLCWQVNASPGRGVKEHQALSSNRGLLHRGRFVFFLARLLAPAASTPRVRVNTSASSIYFHCLHSARQISLFIQTHTHTKKWQINPGPGLAAFSHTHRKFPHAKCTPFCIHNNKQQLELKQ